MNRRLTRLPSFLRPSYTKEWEEYVTRQARWVDFAHHKDVDVLHRVRAGRIQAVSRDKGLAYQGHPALTAGTTARLWSNPRTQDGHEVHQDRTDMVT